MDLYFNAPLRREGRDRIIEIPKHQPRILYNQPLFRYRPELRSIKCQLDAVVEPLLTEGVHGWRKRRSHHTAIERIVAMNGDRISFDVRHFYRSIEVQRIQRLVEGLEPRLWRRIEPYMGYSDVGIPEGCCFSPTLANLYLHDIDMRFPATTRYGDNVMIVASKADHQLRRITSQLLDIGLTVHEVVRNPSKFCNTPLQRLVQAEQSRAELAA